MKFLYMAVVSSILLASCGSGSGSDSGGLPPVRSAGKLSGVAHDAPLRNADVKIYDFTSGSKGELLSETATDDAGDYQISITTADKPILIVAGDNGTYTEEASGRSISLSAGQNISAVTYYQSGETLSLQVTPFTHLARCYAEYLVGEGESVPDALNLANSKIAALAGVEIIKTKPVDVTDINSANIELTPGLKYGFLTAAISSSMVDVSEANGLPAHSQTFLTSMQYSRVACNDIKADGMLDGYGYIDDKTIGALSFGTYPITPYFYRNILAQRILSFAASDNNKTGLDVQKLLVFANALSTNTDSVWAGESGQQVDITGPTIKALIAENSYIGGSTELQFTVEDPIGVNTIKFYIDDALIATQGPNGQTLSINTKNYLDGSHIVKVVAADAIGNETTLETTYNISNTGPAINLTSARVVGDADYFAQGTWISQGADIKTIVADGVDATVNPDGTWEANITLSSGLNTFGVVATDELSNSTTQSYDVGVDLNKPEISVKNLSFPLTTYEGQYNLCNYGTFDQSSSNPICVRSDRVSLDGSPPDRNLQGNDYIYIEFGASDVVGAGVFSQFDDLKVEYKYEKNTNLVVDWTPLTTGYKSSIPGSTNGYFILPIATEYLGDNWFITTPSDLHTVTVKVTDSVGNETTKIYTMNFDVLLYDVSASSSSNAESVMNQPFASRSTIFGNTVTTTATIENPTDNPIYFQASATNDNSIEQIYESAIRVNKMAVRSTEFWRAKDVNKPVTQTQPWVNIESINTWDGTNWVSITPTVETSEYKNVYQDVVADTPTTDWADKTDALCTNGSGYSDYTWTEYGWTETVYGDYAFGAWGSFACISTHVYFDANPSQGDEWVLKKAFEHYFTYENIYEEGYPRNETTELTLNHTINNSGVIVYNKSESLSVEMSNGYYEIPPGNIVEVKKTITLPNLPVFDDSSVANLETFSSYSTLELDKSIAWTLDTTIDLNIYAVVGASAFKQEVGSKHTYTITREERINQ